MADRPRTHARIAGARRYAALCRRAGEEFRDHRLDAGVSQRALSRESGVDQAVISRFEAGLVCPSVRTMDRMGATLGRDLSLRLFPNAGPRIHDRFQAPIVEALIRLLGPDWLVRPEVPVFRPVRGVVDLVALHRGDSIIVATEVQSELHRIERQLRWHAEKAAALPSSDLWPPSADTDTSPTISRLLVLRSTRANRTLLQQHTATFSAAYPAEPAAALSALRGDAAWPGPALLWARVEGGSATILDRRPPIACRARCRRAT